MSNSAKKLSVAAALSDTIISNVSIADTTTFCTDGSYDKVSQKVNIMPPAKEFCPALFKKLIETHKLDKVKETGFKGVVEHIVGNPVAMEDSLAMAYLQENGVWPDELDNLPELVKVASNKKTSPVKSGESADGIAFSGITNFDRVTALAAAVRADKHRDKSLKDELPVFAIRFLNRYHPDYRKNPIPESEAPAFAANLTIPEVTNSAQFLSGMYAADPKVTGQIKAAVAMDNFVRQ